MADSCIILRKVWGDVDKSVQLDRPLPYVCKLVLNEQAQLEKLKTAQKGGKKLEFTPGKRPTLHIGKETLVLSHTIEHLQELYIRSGYEDYSPTPNAIAEMGANANAVWEQMQLRQALRESAEWKVWETMDPTSDPALLALQASYKDHEQKKQSNTTNFVPDLKLGKSGKRAPPKPKSSMSFLKNHRAGMFDPRDARHATTQSMPASPSLGAVVAPPEKQPLATESTLKVPFIHLLAIRPVSQTFIRKTLKCDNHSNPLDRLIDKYGVPSRLDSAKYGLSDRGYKELDVWNFNYKQEDRQEAIDRAVSAYDRLRVSREDKIWQLLLPKVDRGKGKVLSRLQLHGGPIAPSRTPRINVEATAEANSASDAAGPDSDDRKGRLAPSSAEGGPRSRSQDPIKKKKVSEKEAQSKRLFAKDPKRALQTVKAKDSKAVPKEPKAVPKETKVATKEIKVASKERKAASKDSKATAKKAKVVEKATAKVTDDQKEKLSDTSPSSNSMKRAMMQHKRTTSSPAKPSPLASSPPTNASDFENEKRMHQTSSSSSASPAITRPLSRFSDGNSDGTLKRKANDLDNDIHQHGPKRQQTSPLSSSTASSGTSPLVPMEVLVKAQQFKDYYAKYERTHRELEAMESPPKESIEKLVKMRERLVALKAEIVDEAGREI